MNSTGTLSNKLLGLLAEGRYSQNSLREALQSLRGGLTEARLKDAITSLEQTSAEVSLKESFFDLGLSDKGAEIAARGRDPQGLKESFVAMGLSETQAREAARGRDTVLSE